MSKQLTLSSFEDDIDSRILARGRDYYYGGHVLDIEIDGDECVAEVEGSELYTVTVTLDDAGNVLDTECDCPYDFGPYCKHQAAVLYALREHMESDPPNEKVKQPRPNELLTALQGQTKDELIRIIMELAAEVPALKKTLLFELGEHGDEVAEARDLMESYIEKVSNDDCWIYGRDVEEATTGIYLVLGRAANHHNPMKAFELYREALSVTMELLGEADDSDGIIGDCIYTALSGIRDVVEGSEDTLSDAGRRELFELVFKEAADNRYNGWEDWRYDMLHACISFCDLPDCRKRLEQRLDVLLTDATGDDFGMKHGITRLKRVQLSMIERFDGGQAAQDFIDQNIVYSDFREMALERVMKTGDYARVLEIALDGIEEDAELRGLVHKWEDYAYAAYKALGDIDNLQFLARKRVMDDHFTFYEEWKSTYAESEWQQALAGLLAELEQQRFLPKAYTQILIQEDLQEKLIAYCRQNANEIFSFYKHFDAAYASQVNEVFLTAIRTDAQLASNRSHYRRVCDKLKVYRKACGADYSARLVQELRARYPRRPAFLDELSRLK